MALFRQFAQFWALTKPNVVALIVFTAVVGMFLAVAAGPPGREKPSSGASASGWRLHRLPRSITCSTHASTR
jgi:hypothetical protein